MDCFYAAIEVRDNPMLANEPVAVGGESDQRDVLCTCNYVARKYGLHAAIPSIIAYRQCPDLILLPVNMSKYRGVAKRIHAIFREFTDKVKPLALDEAYLDVTDMNAYDGSATLIAKAIVKKIYEDEYLIASAGVAPENFLAKIASGWKKPNGFFLITPDEVSEFFRKLPVEKLFGVGKVTAEELHQEGIKTCADLQKNIERLGRILWKNAGGCINKRMFVIIVKLNQCVNVNL
jgi:DNA polymerase-4